MNPLVRSDHVQLEVEIEGVIDMNLGKTYRESRRNYGSTNFDELRRFLNWNNRYGLKEEKQKYLFLNRCEMGVRKYLPMRKVREGKGNDWLKESNTKAVVG